MLDPYISVIVTAYNRRQYLPEALHSLEYQVLDRGKFEVMVVKNFEDPRSDGIIRRNGWKEVFFHEDLDAVSMEYLGVEESRGDVITFLDDDDMYTPDRLAYVYAAFKTIKDLIWFHNLQINVDEDGRPFPASDPRAHLYVSGQPHFDVMLRSDDKRWLWLIAYFGGIHGNNSSTAVKRHIAEGLKGLRGSFPDLPLFVVAGFSDGTLFHTARRLTYYRLHKGSITRPVAPAPSDAPHRQTLLSLLKRYSNLCESNGRSRPFCLVLRTFFQYLPASARFKLSIELTTKALTGYFAWGTSLGPLKRAYWPIKDYVPNPIREALEFLGSKLK